MNKSKKSTLFYVVILFIVIIIITFSFKDFLGSYIKVSFGFVTKPFFSFSQSINDKTVKKSELKAENKELRKRLGNIIVDYSKFKSLELENVNLKEELEYLNNINYKYELADIISSSSLPDLNMLVINKGSSHGLKKGMPVIYGNGIFIGKIFSVDKFTSQLFLVDNNNSVISAVIQNEQQTPGIVQGKLNLSIAMDFIPQDQNIETDQIVITSGREKYIPHGLVIGQITSVRQQDDDFFQSAIISSPVRLSSINKVVVLIEEFLPE